MKRWRCHISSRHRILEVTGLTQTWDIFEVIFLDEILKMVHIDAEEE